MDNPWKTLIPIGVIVIVVAIVLISRSGSNTPAPTVYNPSPTTSTASQEQATMDAANVNPDSIIGELLVNSTAEQAAFSEETGDSALVSSNNQALINLGQFYDPNQL